MKPDFYRAFFISCVHWNSRNTKNNTMRKIIILNIVLLFTLSSSFAQTESTNDSSPIITGKYFGQEEPGLQAKLFAPGIISTGMFELNAVYSHDYKEFYYSVRILEGPLSIVCRKYINDQWSEPEVVSFSGGQHMDVDPCISKDGKSMCFASNRPIDSSQETNDDFDIWRVTREKEEWSKPERLAINSEQNEFYSSITNDGTLYFSTGRNNASGGGDIYMSAFVDNKFQAAQKLEGDINDFAEGDVFVSNEGDYIIFDCQGREEGTGLYISFKNNDVWDTPIFMGKEVNSSGTEYCPVVSPDGKYLFFTSWKKTLEIPTNDPITYKDYVSYYLGKNSPQNGHPDIYWIDAQIIDKLREENKTR